MPEPITTVASAAVIAYLSKDGVGKLLGPAAEYLDGEMKELVEKSQKTWCLSSKELKGNVAISLKVPVL